MRKKILVIEDNEQNLYLVTYLLEKNGYEVIQAHSGREGIELAGKTMPELILLDIQLPDIDGYEVAREMKRDPSLTHIPKVAVTSYAMPGDRERVLSVGCTGYIKKPIDPDTFVTEIEQHLAGTEVGKGEG